MSYGPLNLSYICILSGTSWGYSSPSVIFLVLKYKRLVSVPIIMLWYKIFYKFGISGLTLSLIQTLSDASAADDFWEHCGKVRNCSKLSAALSWFVVCWKGLINTLLTCIRAPSEHSHGIQLISVILKHFQRNVIPYSIIMWLACLSAKDE